MSTQKGKKQFKQQLLSLQNTIDLGPSSVAHSCKHICLAAVWIHNDFGLFLSGPKNVMPNLLHHVDTRRSFAAEYSEI